MQLTISLLNHNLEAYLCHKPRISKNLAIEMLAQTPLLVSLLLSSQWAGD